MVVTFGADRREQRAVRMLSLRDEVVEQLGRGWCVRVGERSCVRGETGGEHVEVVYRARGLPQPSELGAKCVRRFVVEEV